MSKRPVRDRVNVVVSNLDTTYTNLSKLKAWRNVEELLDSSNSISQINILESGRINILVDGGGWIGCGTHQPVYNELLQSIRRHHDQLGEDLLAECSRPNEDYTTKPVLVRVTCGYYTSEKDYAIDGVDEAGNYTEAVWTHWKGKTIQTRHEAEEAARAFREYIGLSHRAEIRFDE